MADDERAQLIGITLKKERRKEKEKKMVRIGRG